jgi:hypothetical protein
MQINFIQGQEKVGEAGKTVNMQSFNRFFNWCLYLLIVLVPLTFLPITSEVREFNKQTVLFFLVVLMLAVWVIKVLTTRSVSWVRTPLDFLLPTYLVVLALASVLSLDKVSSFLGYYGRFTGSFISVLSLIVLYFLVVNNIRGKNMVQRIEDLIIGSGVVVLFYSFLQILGIYIIRFNFAKTQSFNPIGSLVGLSIFSALILILIQHAWLTQENSGARNILYSIVTLLGLIIMFVINAFIGWLTLTLGLIIFLALALVIYVNNNTKVTWFWKPIVVLVVGIIFVGFQFLPLTLNPSRLINSKLPVEIQLSNSANFNLVKNALVKKPILGFGPGTTAVAFGQIKPSVLNKTVVWNVDFDRASSEFANILIESGFLGFLAFEAIAVVFFFYGLFFLLRKTDHVGRMHAFGFFVLWCTLYLAHFLYFFNTTSYFLYWLSMAVFMAIVQWQQVEVDETKISFNNSPKQAFSWMVVSLFVLAALLIGAFFETAVYLGETAYTSGLNELAKQNPDFVKAGNYFASAINRNPYRDVYYLGLAQDLVFLASQEVGKSNPDLQKFQNWIQQIVASSNTATSISSNKPSNWSDRAQLYTELRSLAVPGTDQVIISSWQEAIKHDSQNPELQVELADAYYTASTTIDPKILGTGTDSDGDGISDQQEALFGCPLDNTNKDGVSDGAKIAAGFSCSGPGRLSQSQLAPYLKNDSTMLKNAEDAAKQAIALKDDLPDPYIQLARIYEKGNNLDQARKELSDANLKFPNNVDIAYELGRILFNQKKYTDAENIFNNIIALVPNHADALFSLGLLAEQKGDYSQALNYYQKVQQITGPNVDLETKIQDMTAKINSTTTTKK